MRLELVVVGVGPNFKKIRLRRNDRLVSVKTCQFKFQQVGCIIDTA